MKKTLKAFALASTFVVSGASVVSCGSQRPPVIEQDDKYIEQNLLEEIIEISNEEFEEFLVERFVTLDNPKVNYFDFTRMKDNFIYEIDTEYEKIVEKNEKIIKKREGINFDSLEIENYNDKISTKFLNFDGKDLTNISAIEENENKRNIGKAVFSEFNYNIFSKKSYKRVKREVTLPILNFYADKKEVKDLINNHNFINSKTFSSFEKSNNELIYTFDSFKRSKYETGDKSEMLAIIDDIGNFFGKNYWNMKEEKQESYLYTNMTKQFATTIMPNGDSQRYDAKNWSGKRPEDEEKYCKVINENSEIDLKHYCGQLENAKQKSEELGVDNSLEIIVRVDFDTKKTGILKENEDKFFYIYFGTIKFVSDNDIELYEYEYEF
ncbi:hypothetical protein [Spiroplasma endosymbiont of Diplazon laetatorius]|uniref:hypothetical protein n=1 Tax=Spiroplasma endosymbiont of Diplazon laetatorius TaxID=3066322 RepID=UPI0030CF8272